MSKPAAEKRKTTEDTIKQKIQGRDVAGTLTSINETQRKLGFTWVFMHVVALRV